MWVFTFLTITSATFVTINYDIVGEVVILNAFFIAFSRIVWGLSIAWVIFACHNGSGGFVNKFLSCRWWIPVGRIGFSLYLIHPVLMYNFTAMDPTNLDTGHIVSVIKIIVKKMWKISSLLSAAVLR
jgi:peptidoglycan/LPS O-acetylase OafA/YrhL